MGNRPAERSWADAWVISSHHCPKKRGVSLLEVPRFLYFSGILHKMRQGGLKRLYKKGIEGLIFFQYLA